MAVRLSKGNNVSLSKLSPSLSEIRIGLGWSTRIATKHSFDLDASAFILGPNGKLLSEPYFVYYNNTVTPCEGVEHAGDNRRGGAFDAEQTDQEEITVRLHQLPSSAYRVAIAVTIHDAETLRQNFGQVENAYIRLVDHRTGVEIARYDLSEDCSSETAMIFGEVYRYQGEWKFRAVGQGLSGGLLALCELFGVEVAG